MATDGIRRHIIRFNSGLQNNSEKKYNAGKRECRGLLKALKKCKHLLIRARFVVELNAKTLVAQLNRSAADLSNAFINQWLAQIRLFDFEVQHIPGRKYSAADDSARDKFIKDWEARATKVMFDVYKAMATAEEAVYKDKSYFKCRRQGIDLDIVPANNPDPDPATRENTE